MTAHASLNTIRDEHSALAAILSTLHLLVRQGPGDDATRFFTTLRAMLFYIDEFPEKLHHPKESQLLFPKVLEKQPALQGAVDRLDREHVRGEAAVRNLQFLLMGWEFLGDARRQAFVDALDAYVAFYAEHMRLEQTEILPAAERQLSEEDWAALDAAFAQNRDPLTGKHPPTELYAAFFQRILRQAPLPFGFGA